MNADLPYEMKVLLSHGVNADEIVNSKSRFATEAQRTQRNNLFLFLDARYRMLVIPAKAGIQLKSIT